LKNKHGRQQRQGKKGMGVFGLDLEKKIVLGAPGFLTYGVFMGKEQISLGSPTAMECQAVQTQMSAWLDDELSEAAGAMLTAHLERCEACRTAWRKLTALDAALSNLAAPVPTGLAERVVAKVRLPRRRQRWFQSVALAACLVLGVALGGTMARSFYGPAAADTTEAEVASLDDFHDFPQGSLGEVVASDQPEEGNGNLK
jgi:anti-sigma factor RsiW